MKPFKTMFRSIQVLAVAVGCLMPAPELRAAEAEAPIPAVIRGGFVFFTKQRPEQAIDAWIVGGLVGEEFKAIPRGTYFREAETTLGKYKSYEHITTKMIGANSKIVYLSINYERGAVYARFLTYRTEKDWVVQSMNFNVRPEALMPWLSYESEQ